MKYLLMLLTVAALVVTMIYKHPELFAMFFVIFILLAIIPNRK